MRRIGNCASTRSRYFKIVAFVAGIEHDALAPDRQHDVVRTQPVETDLAQPMRNRVVLDQRVRDKPTSTTRAAVHRVEAVEPVVVRELDSRERSTDRVLRVTVLRWQRTLPIMHV